MLTFLPLGSRLTRWTNGKVRSLTQQKKFLHYELTKLVHGEEEAEKGTGRCDVRCSVQGIAADMPTAELTSDEDSDRRKHRYPESACIRADWLLLSAEGRRAVQQGGVAVDGEKVSDIAATFAKADFEGDGKVVRKGKKNFRKVIAK